MDAVRDLVAGPYSSEVFQADLSAQARVIHGDTIEVDRARIRFQGIDAPESAQSCLAGGKHWPCGQLATIVLANRSSERTVPCDERDRDRYGRILVPRAVDGAGLKEVVAVGRASAVDRRRPRLTRESPGVAIRRGVAYQRGTLERLRASF